MYFVGCGISGGEEGALHGASIMPSGAQGMASHSADAEKNCGKSWGWYSCCEWVGPGGAGHYVKMVHNGIEYGDMQLIAETYFAMKHLLVEEWTDGGYFWTMGQRTSA